MKNKKDDNKLKKFAVSVMTAPFKSNLKRKGCEYAIYKTAVDTVINGNFDIVSNLLFNIGLFKSMSNIPDSIIDEIIDDFIKKNNDTKKNSK